jgi:hypothetical protein
VPWVNPLDSADPLITALVSGGAAELRGIKAAVIERLDTIFQDFSVADPLIWIVFPGMSGAGAPTSGLAGTGHGVANPGTLYFDTTNKIPYLNIGTLASPTWAPFILGDSV